MGQNVGDDNLFKSTSGFIGNIQIYVFPFKSERIFASIIIKAFSVLDLMLFHYTFFCLQNLKYAELPDGLSLPHIMDTWTQQKNFPVVTVRYYLLSQKIYYFKCLKSS